MKNMGWIKSPLASTDSFTIRSGLSGGEYFIDEVASSITATPTLLPDLMNFNTPEIVRTSNIVSEQIEWSVSFKFTTNTLTSDGLVYLTIPQEVVYDMGDTLTTVLTSNSSTSITNSKVLYSGSSSINTITFNGVCGSSGCAQNDVVTVGISWIKNPPAVTTVTDTIKINSATSQGWIIDEGTSTAVNSLFSTLVANEISSVTIEPDDPSSGASTNYDIIFSADTDIPKDSTVTITLPSEINISSSNTGGTSSLDTCANLFDNSVSLT
jgi:hypothetical protein